MAISYYGVCLSDNMAETPEGYLICKNAVLGRTGFQTYKGGELPQDELADLNLSFGATDDVQVHRPASEVFSPKTMASYEGKPLTDGHPQELVDIDSHSEHYRGHTQNIRRGTESLPDGNFPLLGDIVVTNKELKDRIQRKEIRELSCGYNYHLAMQNGQLSQVDMLGNHTAMVENGRAGKHAKIYDSAVPVLKKTGDTKGWIYMSDFKGMLSALGLKVWAADKSAEEIHAGLKQYHGKDEERKDEPESKDAKVSDARTRLHGALDRMLDSKEDEQKAMDADTEELRKLFSTKADDAAATSDEDDDEEDDDAEDDDKKVEDSKFVGDEEGDIDIDPEDRPKPLDPEATDAAYRKGQKAALDALKPFVAKSGDKKLIAAFDTASKLVKGTKANKGGSYKKAAEAAQRRSSSVGMDSVKLQADAAAAYAARFRK